jgi:repressor of nif and glnA expression
MNEKTEKKRLAILRVLQKEDKPLGSSKITDRLLAMGHELSERTVRFYLLACDRDGLTENLGKRGRRITERGLQELAAARVFEKVGYLAARIDQMTFRMDFDLMKKAGTVVVNVSIIERAQLPRASSLISRVFTAGYAMGHLLTLFAPGERIGEISVPEGKVGIGTVCSITLNGVLLAHGIPTNSRFGGLLELRNYKPSRFVEIIHYDATTLDPLEVFIRSGMTDLCGAVENGNGRIGASFRELPADSRDEVIALARRLERVGLGGFQTIGWPGQPLLEIPVNEGRVGAIVIGGLNPAGILEERGIRCHSRALAGLVDYRKLFHYKELNERIRNLN